MSSDHWSAAQPQPDRVLVVQELLEQIEVARAAGEVSLVVSLEAEYRLLRGDL